MTSRSYDFHPMRGPSHRLSAPPFGGSLGTFALLQSFPPPAQTARAVASPGFVRHPPTDISSGVDSVGSRRRDLAGPAEDLSSASVCRPRGFAPPRRFPPPPGRGLVASHCRSQGSLRFRSPRPVLGRKRHPRSADSYPSKNIPRLQPHRVTTAVASLSLPGSSRRSSTSTVASRCIIASLPSGLGFEALLRCRVGCAASGLATVRASRPSWASFPSEVHSAAAISRSPRTRYGRTRVGPQRKQASSWVATGCESLQAWVPRGEPR